jgi:CHAT domain-containing protein
MNILMSDSSNIKTNDFEDKSVSEKRGTKRVVSAAFEERSSDSISSLITSFSANKLDQQTKREVVVKRIRREIQKEKEPSDAVATPREIALGLIKKITSASDEKNSEELIYYLVQNFQFFKDDDAFFRSLVPIMPFLMGQK